ncbi:aminoacyl-tRNA hydrolase [Candidatus Microgenomates bacterium]|nr:aminoacyl-tRNA hydrolase [Candidatus Microgenomates bacterium]
MKLIVGLGNPGEKYANVRHNLGFMVLDEFVKKMDGGRWKIGVEDRGWKMEGNFKSEILKLVQDDGNQLILAKPQTYMNNSGMAVELMSSAFSLQSSDIIIIHDELDLPLGKIKVRIGGAAAGHLGVESIIKELGTDKFIRIRLGIGNLRTQSGERKGQTISAEKFVLEPFMHSEKAQVKHMIKKAIRALEILLDKGLEKAQNQFN